jgi:hypothetical protein
VLAGFQDGLADEGVGAGPASLAGLKVVRATEGAGTITVTGGKATK